MYSSQDHMSPSSAWSRFEGSQGWQRNSPWPSQRDAANGRRNTTAENICPWLEHLPSQSCAISIEAWCPGISPAENQLLQLLARVVTVCLELGRSHHQLMLQLLPCPGGEATRDGCSSLLLTLPRAWWETAQEKYRNSMVLRGKCRLIRSQTKKREWWAIYSGSAFLREGKQNSFAYGSEEHNIKHIWGLWLNVF